MEGWRQVRIGEVCKTGAGGTPLKSRKEYYEGGSIPWLLSGAVGQGEIRKSTTFITQEGLDNSSAKLFPPDSVLVAMYGATAGEVGILRFESSTNQAVCGIYPNDDFVPEFLYYAILSKKAALIATAAGNAQPNISQRKIRDTQVSLPPLPEQERIVAILDEAFAAIATATANAEKNLANARELFESELNRVFSQLGEGGEEKTLGEICEITSKLVDPCREEYIDLPHVGAGNMASRTGELANMQTAREEGLKSSKFVFDNRMVLYSKIRPYLMKVCCPSFSGLCSADVYPLLPSGSDNSREFLFYLLLSERFTDYAISGSARAGMPKVNREHLFSYRCPIPSLDHQLRIVTMLDDLSAETRRLENSYQKKCVFLLDLKQSILHKAFTGELTANPKAHDRTLSEANL
jgi:type I restriction enzyme S subunit